MPNELADFRAASGGTLEREIAIEPWGVCQKEAPDVTQRIRGWLGQSDKTHPERIKADRIRVKQAFVVQLRKAEGANAAHKSCDAGGLTSEFIESERPLTNRMVTRILQKAQQFRRQCVTRNECKLERLIVRMHGHQDADLRGTLRRELKGRPDFGDLVLRSQSAYLDRDLLAAVRFEVKSHPKFGSEILSEVELRDAFRKAEEAIASVRAKQLARRFPGTSKLMGQAYSRHAALLPVDRRPEHFACSLMLYCAERRFERAQDALIKIGTAGTLLGELAWSVHALSDLGDRLVAWRKELVAATVLLSQRDNEQSCLRQIDRRLEADLQDALIEDVARHIDLIDAKIQYIQELQLINPLTDRAVAYFELISFEAGADILRRLQEDATAGRVALSVKQQEALTKWERLWTEQCMQASFEYACTAVSKPALAIDDPQIEDDYSHPVAQTKRKSATLLKHILIDVKLPSSEIEQRLSPASLSRAKHEVLSRIGTWQPVRRDLVVARDGALQIYRSELLPAHRLHHSFGSYRHGSTIGVPSGARSDPAHARNLKLSRLYGPSGQLLSSVVRHAVLDAWVMTDMTARQDANTKAAKEVLELALSSNQRLSSALIDVHRARHERLPRMVHVDICLLSTNSVRSLLPSSFKQDVNAKDLTVNQFKAFSRNAGLARSLRILNLRGSMERLDAKINVDVITFSFGINIRVLATPRNLFRDSWSDIHAHNTRNMVKLIGDLGVGPFGARSARPGGFIGEAYDRLEEWAISAAGQELTTADRLLAQLRHQTDRVRILFSERKFEQGNGDPAKMCREVLVLQGLAEQALDLSGSSDLAGTMSHGCENDKDLGGITDVELKTKIILKDMGGDLHPDQELFGDDLSAYYVVSAGSGELENQRWNTGLPGSTALSETRITDLEMRRLLAGLARFAEA